MDTQIISLANQKGGVGKTTTCANLGIGLAREGKRVLLVDCDPQASLTLSLGWRKPETLPVTLATLMGRVLQEQPVHAEEAILHHAEGVDFIPGSIALSGVEASLDTRQNVLKRVLDDCRKDYSRLYAVAGHDDDQRTGGGRQRADSDHTALFVGRWTW